MDDKLYPRERDIIPCCIHLRTKTMACMDDEMRAGEGFIKVTTTGTYWCNHTQAAFGPDEEVARPHLCQPGRACYERTG